MKRSYALETLSWEHHNGLVLAFRLEQGIQHQVAFQELKKYLLHVWQTALQSHFTIEEIYLIVPDFPESIAPLVNRMLADHQKLLTLVEQIKGLNKKTELLTVIEQFCETLKNHIRFEERELYPAIEKNLSKNRARTLGNKLHELHKPIDMSWPWEFWKQKNGKHP